MTEDALKVAKDRLNIRLASTLFNEIDALDRLERDAEERMRSAEAEIAAIKFQRQQIQKMLDETGIERSEIAQSASGVRSTPSLDNAAEKNEKTHKQMILETITEAGVDGLRAIEISSYIQRRYRKDISSGLHTQLARLKREGKITRAGVHWCV